MITLRRHETHVDRSSSVLFEVFSVRYSQALGQAGLVEAEIRLPVGGLLSGPRYATLSVDGADVATGKISGFPSGLAGDIVTITLDCSADDVSEQIDALFEAIPVSEHLENKERKRRSQAYTPHDVYIDPRTGRAELVQIGGGSSAATTIGAEGGGGAWDAFSISLAVTAEPIKEVVLKATATWTEIAAEVIDYGSLIGITQTLTPAEYEQAIDSITTSGPGYTKISAGADPIAGDSGVGVQVTTRRPHVSPITGIRIGKKVVEIRGRRYNPPRLRIATCVEEQRGETFELSVTAGVQPAYGGRVETVDLSFADPERTIERLFEAYRTYTLPGQTGEWYFSTPVIGDEFIRASDERDLIISNLIGYAGKLILEAGHCCRVDVEVTAECARSLTLRDTVVVTDSRLPNGSAMGQITAIEWTDGAEGLGRLSIRVPVGTSWRNYVSPYVDDVAGDVTPAPRVEDLRAHNALAFVKSSVITGTYDEQMQAVQQINAQNNTAKPEADPYVRASETIRRVADYLPKPSIELQFVELGATDAVYESRVKASASVSVKSGV